MDIKNKIDKLGIKKGNKLLISSSIIKIIINFKKKKIVFNPNMIIDILKDKVGKSGTLLFPTFNWDFCKGKTFDYEKTPSRTGSLSKFALARSDFSRSKNPIYSFAVWGKDKEKICNLKHEDCYGLNSPFGYLIKNKGKHLLIDLQFPTASRMYFGGFPFHHVAEQQANIDYRYFKNFTGMYIDKFKKKSEKTFKYFVRDLNLNYSVFIRKSLNKVLTKKKILKTKFIDDVRFELIDIAGSMEVLTKDLKSKRKFFWKKKN
jgi:aminoglycoside 3-N-acetyltransferase